MWTWFSNIAKFVGPVERRRMYQLRAPPQRQCLIRRRRLTFFSWMLLSLCMPWTCFPKIHYSFWFRPRTIMKFGMFFLVVGWASSAHPRATRWMRGGGRMRFGRICAQNEELNCNFRESDHIHGPARGIYNRLIEDVWLPSRQILSEVQWCLNAMISARRFSAYQMALGPNPVDLFGWAKKR